jgi:hypothetical protein
MTKELNKFLKIFSFLSIKKISNKLKYKKMLKLDDSRKRFETIYQQNLWGDLNSGSGTGSNLESTENLRTNLPIIFKKYNIQSILDVPCGDFHWMKFVMDDNNHIKYKGGDIVESVINSNIKNYTSDQVEFSVIDLTRDHLPSSDLIIVRDCLFHLSFSDIDKAIRNIKNSNLKYILTSTHIVNDNFFNTDISTGDFRLIDIFADPISFKGPVLERIADTDISGVPREMCLFMVDQI